jgi:hypothetical protein
MTRPPAAPLRPLGTAEILDGSVRLVRTNLAATMAISVPLAIVRTAVVALLQYAAIESRTASTLSLVGELVVATGLGAVLTGLLSPMYGSGLLGQPLGAAESLRRVGRRGWALAALGLVITVCEAAGLAACLVGGIWLWGVWAVAAPALVLERGGVRGALGRSVHLVQGRFWRTWGIRALGGVLTEVLGLLIAVPFGALASYLSGINPFDPSAGAAHAQVFVTVTAIGGLVSAALLGPISAAIDLMLYTDLRMRREGMDIELGLPPVPSAAAPSGPTATAW